MREILLWEGKGNKDRINMLLIALMASLREQIECARVFYDMTAITPAVGSA